MFYPFIPNFSLLGWLKAVYLWETKVQEAMRRQQNIGPSGVRALPLDVAAERSIHYIWYYCQAQPQQASSSRAKLSFILE